MTLTREIGRDGRFAAREQVDELPASGVQSTDLLAVVEECQRAFNQRDLDALAPLLDPKIEIEIDSFTLRGIDAALGFARRIDQTFPGIVSETVRVAARSGDDFPCGGPEPMFASGSSRPTPNLRIAVRLGS